MFFHCVFIIVVIITVYLCICIFSFVKAKCGKLLQERLVHLSDRTIKGSSYRDHWGVPYLDGDYSWCPKGVDIKREIELELSKRRVLLNLGRLVKVLAKSIVSQTSLICIVLLPKSLGIKLLDSRGEVIRVSSFNGTWILPLADRNYNWLPIDGGSHRELSKMIQQSDIYIAVFSQMALDRTALCLFDCFFSKT